jgi:hypothetical protein
MTYYCWVLTKCDVVRLSAGTNTIFLRGRSNWFSLLDMQLTDINLYVSLIAEGRIAH